MADNVMLKKLLAERNFNHEVRFKESMPYSARKEIATQALSKTPTCIIVIVEPDDDDEFYVVNQIQTTLASNLITTFEENLNRELKNELKSHNVQLRLLLPNKKHPKTKYKTIGEAYYAEHENDGILYLTYTVHLMDKEARKESDSE